MKRLFILILAVFSMAALAETVSKLSSPFTFPTTVGTVHGVSWQASELMFGGAMKSSGKSIVVLSWSLPTHFAKGTISVFALSGAKVKTFDVADRQGTVQWDISSTSKLANGVYFATLSSGAIKKNIQLLVSR